MRVPKIFGESKRSLPITKIPETMHPEDAQKIADLNELVAKFGTSAYQLFKERNE